MLFFKTPFGKWHAVKTRPVFGGPVLCGCGRSFFADDIKAGKLESHDKWPAGGSFGDYNRCKPCMSFRPPNDRSDP
jgi:hypothetical protein